MQVWHFEHIILFEASVSRKRVTVYDAMQSLNLKSVTHISIIFVFWIAIATALIRKLFQINLPGKELQPLLASRGSKRTLVYSHYIV